MIKTNSSDNLPPIPGAAYIRYSSETQSDSFSLDAQLRQINEQAERDNVTIIKVYSDPAQSVYRKKYRQGINAMRDGARRGCSKSCMSTRSTGWRASWQIILARKLGGSRPNRP